MAWASQAVRKEKKMEIRDLGLAAGSQMLHGSMMEYPLGGNASHQLQFYHREPALSASSFAQPQGC